MLNQDFFTADDLEAYGGQRQAVMLTLSNHVRRWVSVGFLEGESGSTRVAAIIDKIRDDFEVEMRRNPNGRRAQYRLVGRRTEMRVMKPHCGTCYCRPENISPEQMEMKI